MIELKHISYKYKRLIFIIATGFLFSGIFNVTKAQEHPPRPPSITMQRNLSFGAFYHGALGGSITISPEGGRSKDGDVVLLGMGYPYFPAIFYIFSNPGTIISVLNGPDVPLSWNGFSMNLKIGTSVPVAPFINNNPYSLPTELSVGATLTVGPPASNPPGAYTGTFNITLVIE